MITVLVLCEDDDGACRARFTSEEATNAAQVRKEARADGWRRLDGLDVCPEHVLARKSFPRRASAKLEARFMDLRRRQGDDYEAACAAWKAHARK